jgi:hypothetical protein
MTSVVSLEMSTSVIFDLICFLLLNIFKLNWMKTSAFKRAVVSLFLLLVCIYKLIKKEIEVRNQLSRIIIYKLSVNCLTI